MTLSCSQTVRPFSNYYRSIRALLNNYYLLLLLIIVFFDLLDASVKDMEAAAIAWAADLSKTPFIALKVVTDIVDGDRPAEEEFFENLATAAASLQVMVPKVIEFVVGKSLHML
jgi:Phosphorylase superfamily